MNSQDVDLFRNVNGKGIHGKQTVMKTGGAADANLPSNESTSPLFDFPAILTNANYRLEEPHRDATSMNPALDQSGLRLAVSRDATLF